ncbi:hypothetical protein BC833DRAFT_584782 [Globomyces pollinis-pini]|nr:hypothetical protein BC833DRAFT_584782 [Globomyces pollinis-pini]
MKLSLPIGFKKISKDFNYAKVNQLQSYLSTNFNSNVFLLVEHPPTYTIGRRMKVKILESELRKKGADYHASLRGGQITFHGPGQLVGYPIIDLRHYKLGVRDYVCRLEKSLIATCKEFGIKANTTDDTGVWIENRKIAALGIHIQRYITSHGFALNCNTDLSWFDHIVPCNLPGKYATSISKELSLNGTKVNVTIDDVIPIVVKQFAQHMNTDVVPLSSINPSLDREIDVFLNTSNINQ